jgi:hypothetical protein
MPKYHISDNMAANAKAYINQTGAKLGITSMSTGFYVEFPAFLTDFSQTFDATWNTEDVYGRMDPIATYQGTKRTMSLGFDLPAGSLGEAEDNLENCSRLTKMVYPVYSTEDRSGNHIVSKPPLVRIKFANLIENEKAGLLGWITGLSWKPNLEMGMFTADKKFFPKIISISFSFNILHERRLDQKALPENWPFGG